MSEKYFNDDQIDYMADLAAHPELVCACGWHWKTDCAQYCQNPEKRDALALPAPPEPAP